MQNLHFKDDILDNLSKKGNVAQFISFSPELEIRHFKLFNSSAFDNIRDNIEALILKSSEKRVNVRSFNPEQPKGHPFTYGLETVNDVLDVLEKRRSEGLYTIVNETIDTNDGGVSGVVLGNIIEFTPNDTPKGVDKPGVCSLPRKLAIDILKCVYGVSVDLAFSPTDRVEFSLHPKRRGIKNEQIILWELEEFEDPFTDTKISWPNNFSKLIGDKVFGLLVAHFSGFKVPKTTAITRRIAPFTFGNDTNINETWIRTAPFDRTPGKYSTFFGWHDPFKLLAEEDPYHDKIAAVLSQQSVDSAYSGSLITDENDRPIIEGVEGKGDQFMVGLEERSTLPSDVIEKVIETFDTAFSKLGPLEMEWVYDRSSVWVVQLHALKEKVKGGNVIYPGEAIHYYDFFVSEGLDALRAKIANIAGQNIGITIHGNVGVTSHFGDVLRKAKIPSLIVR